MGDITLQQIVNGLAVIVLLITNVEFVMRKFKKSIPPILKDTLQPIYDKLEAVDKKQQKLEKKIDQNEADRIRAEMFHYGSVARITHYISERDWFHVQAIYRKYRDELHQNGEVVHEYEVIQECYDAQFSEGNGNDDSHHIKL